MHQVWTVCRAFAAAAALVSCWSGVAAAQADKMTFRIGVQSDLKFLDPIVTPSRVTSQFANSVYETLFNQDINGVPRPQMVGDYKVSDDKLTYTFTLRPGLKWHSGGKVTSADVVVSLKRWMGFDPVGRKLNEFTASLEAVDADTFKLTLKRPYGLVLQSFAKPSPGSPFIMPERLARNPLDKPITEVDGSGPFVFKADEWRPGNRVVFEKFKDYVPRSEPPSGKAGGHVVKINRMVWSYIPDNNTGLAALRAGEIDLLDEVPFDFVPIIKGDRNLKLVFTYNGTLGFVRPNFTQPPFNHEKARQALWYLVDQQEFMKAAVGDPDLYMNCYSFFICGSENGTEAGSERFRGKDLNKAKQLFKEAGYNGEPVVVLLATDRVLYNAWTQVLIQNLRDAGVNVQVAASEWGALMSRWAKKTKPTEGGWNLNVGGQPPGGTDPIKNPFFAPACDKAILGWPCDQQTMEMIDAWSRQTDPAKQKEMIEKINARAFEVVPYLILGQYRQPVAVRANVEGVLKSGEMVFWNIEKK